MSNPLQNDLEHILGHTRGLWDEVRGKRLFITGGTGAFGCWLLESLLYANEQLGLDVEVVVLTRDIGAFKMKAPHLARHPVIQFHVGDVLDFTFPKGPFSFVIHSATEASAGMNPGNPLLMFDTIVEGTRRVLDFTVQAGVKKILLTSSGAVYGKQPLEMTHVPESYLGAPDPLDTGSVYGEGKRTAELLCEIYAKQHGLEPKIARCFAFVGPYLPLDSHYAIGNFIRDSLRGGPIIVNGDGTPYRSYLYAADLTIWLWTILLRGKSGRSYNVGSGHEYPIGEIASIVAKSTNAGQVEIRGKLNSKSHTERYVPDVARVEAELGLTVKIELEEAICRTFKYHIQCGATSLGKIL